MIPDAHLSAAFGGFPACCDCFLGWARLPRRNHSRPRQPIRCRRSFTLSPCPTPRLRSPSFQDPRRMPPRPFATFWSMASGATGIARIASIRGRSRLPRAWSVRQEVPFVSMTRAGPLVCRPSRTEKPRARKSVGRRREPLLRGSPPPCQTRGLAASLSTRPCRATETRCANASLRDGRSPVRTRDPDRPARRDGPKRPGNDEDTR